MIYQHEKIWLSIDSLVLGYDPEDENLKILLFERQLEPFANEWSLIGGFVNPNENTDDAARRVLQAFTGLNDVFLEQLHVFGQHDRDPGGQVVSILYWSLIKLDEIHKDIVVQHGARWFDIHQLPSVVMDHDQMIAKGIDTLKKRAVTSPIGFELLPSRFTLPQLLRLYEAIYDRKIDDRNFRKKILATNILQRLDQKDKSTSKKGAYLYEFDQKQYQKFKHSGFHLEFNIS
ncbi:MAG: NUDIX hydrolase [Cyclobacteriaceae bacterium]